LVKAIGKGTVYAAMFEGEAGTGKSTAARVICYRCGLPWVSVNLSLNVDESDLFGAMMPNPEKKDANDPEFVWRDGLITKAIRNGYGAILEEVNAARPGVLMKLNALLDDSRQIELSDGELVKAHPNFRLIATCNIGYEGTNRMNKAFVDRFDVCHMFEAPDKTSAIGIVKTRTGYADMAKIEKAYAAYEAVRKYSNEQRLGLTVSIRRLIAMFKGGRCYKSAKDAFVACVVDPAFLECPDQRKYFMENVLTAYDLSYKL
jgi:midasin (ATPase involved in ribosome maturation)